MKSELDNAITRKCRKPVYDTIFGTGQKYILGASCGEVSANGRSARCFAGS